jgi:hypothetical protein
MDNEMHECVCGVEFYGDTCTDCGRLSLSGPIPERPSFLALRFPNGKFVAIDQDYEMGTTVREADAFFGSIFMDCQEGIERATRTMRDLSITADIVRIQWNVEETPIPAQLNKKDIRISDRDAEMLEMNRWTQSK